jgi:hypothetical protein
MVALVTTEQRKVRKGKINSFMPYLQHICQVIYDSHIGTGIRESDYVFSIIESIHVLAITLLVGTIAVLDLRMLGVILRGVSVTRIARTVFPLTWSGFAVMFVSGCFLFWAEAAKNYSNPAFRVKLILLVLVGLNPLFFIRQSSAGCTNGSYLNTRHGGREAPHLHHSRFGQESSLPGARSLISELTGDFFKCFAIGL